MNIANSYEIRIRIRWTRNQHNDDTSVKCIRIDVFPLKWLQNSEKEQTKTKWKKKQKPMQSFQVNRTTGILAGFHLPNASHCNDAIINKIGSFRVLLNSLLFLSLLLFSSCSRGAFFYPYIFLGCYANTQFMRNSEFTLTMFPFQKSPDMENGNWHEANTIFTILEGNIYYDSEWNL